MFWAPLSTSPIWDWTCSNRLIEATRVGPCRFWDPETYISGRKSHHGFSRVRCLVHWWPLDVGPRTGHRTRFFFWEWSLPVASGVPIKKELASQTYWYQDCQSLIGSVAPDLIGCPSHSRGLGRPWQPVLSWVGEKPGALLRQMFIRRCDYHHDLPWKKPIVNIPIFRSNLGIAFWGAADRHFDGGPWSLEDFCFFFFDTNPSTFGDWMFRSSIFLLA